MNLIKATVAVPFAVIFGVYDACKLIFFTIADLPALCWQENCWPWETYGGLDIDDQND